MNVLRLFTSLIPNNPTGTIFTRSEFDAFYRHIPERVLIILDEAYFEYAKDDPRYPDSMHYRYDNVITLRTFSKAYGLAGVRIGYGFAHESLISNLLKVKLPFEPSSVAEAAGIAALDDREFLHRTLETNARGMQYVSGALKEMGIVFVPSEANFVMTLWPSPEAAERITEELLENGVIVRPLAPFGVPRGIRITIGTDEENEILVTRLAQIARVRESALCSRIAETIKTRDQADFLPLNGTDHIEFWVGNAKQAAYFYRAAFGMAQEAYRGPETGVRDRASYMLRQGRIRFVVTSSLRPDHEIADHVRRHGDGVRDIALWVDDADAAWRETTSRGARSVRDPFTTEDENGRVRIASIESYGDTVHSFIERRDYRGCSCQASDTWRSPIGSPDRWVSNTSIIRWAMSGGVR